MCAHYEPCLWPAMTDNPHFFFLSREEGYGVRSPLTFCFARFVFCFGGCLFVLFSVCLGFFPSGRRPMSSFDSLCPTLRAGIISKHKMHDSLYQYWDLSSSLQERALLHSELLSNLFRQLGLILSVIKFCILLYFILPMCPNL